MAHDNLPRDTQNGSTREGARGSVMSYEAPSTPSNSGDSISEASTHEDDHPYNHDYHEKTLTPHLSRASSTSAIGGIMPTQLQRARTNKSTATNATTDMAFEVDFEENDKDNPLVWPLWFKGVMIAVMSYSTTTVVLYSTSYTSAIPGLIEEFGISDNTGILGVTTYLLGMACGSIVLAPLSEMYGRRPVYIIALGLFVIFVLPCALAENIATILVVRFIGAFCAAAMISNAPGTINDISDEEVCDVPYPKRHYIANKPVASCSCILHLVNRANEWSGDWPRCGGLRLPVSWMEVDELGSDDRERCCLGWSLSPSRDVRTSATTQTRGETTEGHCR